MSDNKVEFLEDGHKAARYVLQNMIADVDANIEDDSEPELSRYLEDLQQTEANLIASWSRLLSAR